MLLNIPKGTLVKKEACTEGMSTCLTALTDPLALDLPAPGCVLDHDRVARGRRESAKLRCTQSSTSVYDEETEDHGRERSC